MPTDITGIHEKLIKYDGRLQYEVWHKMMRSAKNGERLQGGGGSVLYMINSLPIRAICHREAITYPGGYDYDLVISFRYCRELWAALA